MCFAACPHDINYEKSFMLDKKGVGRSLPTMIPPSLFLPLDPLSALLTVSASFHLLFVADFR